MAAGTNLKGKRAAKPPALTFRDRIESRRFLIATAIAAASLLVGLPAAIDWVSGRTPAHIITVPVTDPASHRRGPAEPSLSTDRILTVPYEGREGVAEPKAGSEMAQQGKARPPSIQAKPSNDSAERTDSPSGKPDTSPSQLRGATTDVAVISGSSIKGNTQINATGKDILPIAGGKDAHAVTEIGSIEDAPIRGDTTIKPDTVEPVGSKACAATRIGAIGNKKCK